MPLEAWITVAVVAGVLVLLAGSRQNPALILLGAVGTLILTGVLAPQDALGGFGNSGLATVAVLYVVAAGLSETGASGVVIQTLLGNARTLFGAQARMLVPVSVTSAFLNNTPVVAVMMPVVHDWARRHAMAASKLLIPLSYASILGGMCTMIGTSTNLIIGGLYRDAGYGDFGLFAVTVVGVPTAVVGLLYLLLVGRRLLPNRKPAAAMLENAREYTLEMRVTDSGPLTGKSIEEAGLRHLPGSYLAEIHRGDRVMPAVSPRETLQAGDQLVFVGVLDSMVDLQRLPGLEPATDQRFRLDTKRDDRVFAEVVVSPNCPLLGQSIREGRFRNHYNAAVLAVSRGGERIRSKIGDIVLQPGDTLLLETSSSFYDTQRNNRDFYLVSRVEGHTPQRRTRLPLATGILTGMVLLAGFGWLTMLEAGILAAAAMIATRCVGARAAGRAVDLQVLVVIGAAIGLGEAMHQTGAAATSAGGLIGLSGGDPRWLLALTYITASLFTEMITNNAAAVLVFPVVTAAASSIGAPLEPFMLVLMIGSSASFATPIGYQTNLMVYGPGGYRFRDFVRIGLPLNVIVGAASVLVTIALYFA